MQCPFYGTLGGSQRWSGQGGKSLPLPGLNSRTIQPVDIPTEPSLPIALQYAGRKRRTTNGAVKYPFMRNFVLTDEVHRMSLFNSSDKISENSFSTRLKKTRETD